MRFFCLISCLYSAAPHAEVFQLQSDTFSQELQVAPALFSKPSYGVAAEISLENQSTEVQYNVNLEDFEYALTVPIKASPGKVQITSFGIQYIYSEKTAGISIGGMF